MNKEQIENIRAFNRLYTSILGLADGHILNSEYSLSEVRIMFEVYHRPGIQSNELIQKIGIDKGYLSRLLKQFARKGIIKKVASPEDKRATSIMLSKKGKQVFEVLNAASENQIRQIFKSLSTTECNQLVQSMVTIEKIISESKG